MELYSKSEIFEVIKKFLKENKDSVLEILGPTASGKTGFAIEIAQKFGPAEIISVDSRQIYKDINIASAKATAEEMRGVPHWGLDLISPADKYSVAEFQQYAFEKIKEIQARKALPILCGGTMLWLDAISENYLFSGEQGEKSTKKGKPRFPVLKVGIHWEREKLYERINKRSEIMFQNGLIEETREILKKHEMGYQALTSFGYLELQKFIEGEISKNRALELNKQRNRNYAKRQLTWWRGREDVHWIKLV